MEEWNDKKPEDWKSNGRMEDEKNSYCPTNGIVLHLLRKWNMSTSLRIHVIRGLRNEENHDPASPPILNPSRSNTGSRGRSCDHPAGPAYCPFGTDWQETSHPFSPGSSGSHAADAERKRRGDPPRSRCKMNEIIYLDTSALAKWYLNEERSADVEKYIQDQGPVAISDLTTVEMRCLLARRRREKNIDSKMEMQIWATFQDDIRQNSLICYPLPADLAAGAINLLSVLADLPLRTLDAFHLVIAREIQSDILVTADRIMAAGARAMGFSVVGFGKPGVR
jgi:hypothetical protein